MRRFAQAGSALTEAIIVMTFMVPLMLGVPMIGKLIDLQQTTVQASRYVAWETTVRDGLPSDLGERFFSDASAPLDGSSSAPNSLWGIEEDVATERAVTTADTPASTSTTDDGEYNAGVPWLNPYWRDTAIRVDAASANAVRGSGYESDRFGASADRGPAEKIGGFIDKLDSIAGLTGGKWGADDAFDTDGFIRAEASARAEGNTWLGPLTFTQGTVLLNDNWSAKDAEQARDRVLTMVPAGALQKHGVGDVIGAIGNVPGVTELKPFGNDEQGVFGYINMEPLPESEVGTPRPLKDYQED